MADRLKVTAPTLDEPFRLAMLVSHPIQYLAPLFSKLASRPEVDPTVYFMSDIGLKASYVEGFGETLKWDRPVLDGYRSVFLRNLSPQPNTIKPWARIHPEFLLELRRGRYDAVFMHGYTSITEWLTFVGANAMKIPILFYGEVLINSPMGSARTQWMRDKFRTTWCAGIDAALAMSTRGRQFYDHYAVDHDRVFWVPLCVDNGYFMTRSEDLRPSQRALKSELGLDPDLPVLLFVAHMRDKKRPLDLVRAHQRMRHPSSLVMVGGGPLFDSIREYCSAHGLSRIVPVGTKNQSELPRFYAMSDVFVLPSGPGEVTPLVIHEAMCSSLPLVLSSAVPSTLDFLHDGINGSVFPWGEIDRLAETLDRIISDPAKMREMGLASRQIISKWTYDMAADGIVAALRAVVRRRPS
jgi:glycosyltransferase involved in cell wall biosynthesis